MSATTAGLAGSRRRELEHAFVNSLLAVVPAVVTAFLVITAFGYRWGAYDFHWSYYPAAHRLLAGGDPYAVTRFDIQRGIAFVYPALSALVFAPFALMGRSLADHLYMLMCFLLVPATLWVAGVRDWRVYGLVFMWQPVVVGWQGGNLTVPLAFLAAVAWRYRDRPVVAGLATALAISLKPFVWPLAVWLLVTRRWKAAAAALVSGVTLNLVAWATVGFDQLHVYLGLSDEVTKALWRGGYSVLAIGHHLGLGRGVGELLLVASSAALVAALFFVGFVKRQERQAMVVAIALMLVASPLVWSHYFVLLMVPLAITRPRFAVLWLVPVVMFVCPPSTTVTGLEAAIAWVVAALCLQASFRAPTATLAEPA